MAKWGIFAVAWMLMVAGHAAADTCDKNKIYAKDQCECPAGLTMSQVGTNKYRCMTDEEREANTKVCCLTTSQAKGTDPCASKLASDGHFQILTKQECKSFGVMECPGRCK
jgi:hypothetical protein